MTKNMQAKIESLNAEIELLKPYAHKVANGSKLQSHLDRANEFCRLVKLRDELDAE